MGELPSMSAELKRGINMATNELYEECKELIGKKVIKVSKQTVKESSEFKMVIITFNDGSEIQINDD